MRLSETQRFGLTILRDGQFASLGLLIHSHPSMLVCFYDAKFAEQLLSNPAVSAVITNNELSEIVPKYLALATSSDPVVSFYSLHEHLLRRTDFYRQSRKTEVHPSAVIEPGAYIAPDNVDIGPDCYIGTGAKIFPGSKLREDVKIGPGVVIGWDGFEPKQVGDKRIIIPHAGGVEIQSAVEILPNTNIQKSVFTGDTVVSEESKIDGLVTIGHNVFIGKRCKIACNTCIAGSTAIGNDVWIGPGSVLSSAITIGAESFVSLGSVVMKSIPARCRVAGNPARIIANLNE
jgi:UDP-3-O-[3-hydroxymyristoyl] glucosamine N-acyltransferase